MNTGYRLVIWQELGASLIAGPWVRAQNFQWEIGVWQWIELLTKYLKQTLLKKMGANEHKLKFISLIHVYDWYNRYHTQFISPIGMQNN